MGITSIQWTSTIAKDGTVIPGYTFNPWIGCTKVAPGCANCYAEADMDKRRGRVQWGPNGSRSRTSDSYWRDPIKWNNAAQESGERHRVFCASLADVFEDWKGRFVDTQGRTLHRGKPWGVKEKYVYDHVMIGKSVATIHDLRADLFELIDATPHLDWLLLTKRPENILRVICPNEDPDFEDNGISHYHRKNLWLGTSVSDQETANKAVPELLRCRALASVLFLSAEPLLGPIDLTRVGNHDGTSANRFDGNCLYVGDIGGAEYAWSPRNFIQWVIDGAESGPNKRPYDLKWSRDLQAQCQAAGVAYFRKQIGESIPGLQDKKGGDWDEWPEDLRVREFPIVKAAL